MTDYGDENFSGYAPTYPCHCVRCQRLMGRFRPHTFIHCAYCFIDYRVNEEGGLEILQDNAKKIALRRRFDELLEK